MLYNSTKFCEIISNGIKEDTISLRKITKGNNYAKKCRWRCRLLLISAGRLVMHYIFTKFCEITLNGIKVKEPTPFHY